MSPPEKLYRAYVFDAKKRILTSDRVKAETDEQALAAVHAAEHGTKCELWDGDRLVATLEAERRQA